ncbi:2-C-methyl-D-erythritol 4-phosphate cytidylyltransferase [Congregibacter litoralis]|uniref:2-C-methyl-D-erythritol 4-phosphate cytidylyltransferase n=1 Tax=Congregibacter litoralis KT71 TaxID=314285 RepID=A4A558_9GAMM|nr:2-C-methyl-D-erythritol 4-phosphate cytidylyltransferase [Congregibacter litoralis]EAQ98929.1 2-C-methyl-D-erythritol 4-phosphate cytidylyltransferase [Congregibacter litoralis KT71]
MTKVYAAILSGGTGTRFLGDIPKQYVKLAGRTILEHTISVFDDHDGIDEVIIVVAEDFRNYVEELLLRNAFTKVSKIVIGGATRQDSSAAAIGAINNDNDYVLLHDAVRPLVSSQTISDCISAVRLNDAVDVVTQCADTIVETHDGVVISKIPDRSRLRRGLTPQAFRVGLLRRAHATMKENHDTDFTDDCGIVVKYKLAPVVLVHGTSDNIKITYPEDIFIADKFFQMRSISIPQQDLSKLSGKVMIVIGGSRGIGESIRDCAAEHGVKTYSLSRSDGVDIADPQALDKAFADVFADSGRIDYIVCTAAVLQIGKLVDRSVTDLKAEIDVNYFGSLYAVKFGAPYLSKSKGSLVLFTSSSYTRGRALYASYSSIKAAIVNLVQATAEELAKDSVSVNAINPERTATPMRVENFGHEDPNSLMDASVVAKATLATLLSNVTGQVINVNKAELK